MSETRERWQDWATLGVGVALATPSVFGTTVPPAAAWAGFVGGVVLAVAGMWAVLTPTVRFTAWAEVVVGVVIFIAPWVLGYSDLTSLAWGSRIAGILAVGLGGSVLLSERARPSLARQH